MTKDDHVQPIWKTDESTYYWKEDIYVVERSF